MRMIGVLPLYLAVATALGFVDFRVRTHHERDLEYTAAVIAGTEPAPGRYRILAPYAFSGLTRLTGLAPADSWFLFRWLCLLAALVAGHLYFRTWYDEGATVAGNLLMAALVPLTFTNAWAHPDHLMELFLFTLGCLCVARGWLVAFTIVLALNALNRETSAFLVLLFALARPIERRHVIWTVALGALWVTIYTGLRWSLGFDSYDPWQLRHNLEFLALLPRAYDPYYRAFAWFVAIMIGPLLVLIARAWPMLPRMHKAAAAVVTPAFVAVAFLFSSVIETRIFTPLLPLLVPGALAALFPMQTGVPGQRQRG
jgi:hypothetical protein